MTILLITVLVFAALVLVLLTARRDDGAQREQTLSAAIDRLLPQTQCRACGYPGCKPYARAVAAGEAGINLCPPGGEQTVRALAAMLGKSVKPPQDRTGVDGRAWVAVIDEEACIGCVKCINACPVDAIVGAPKQMHTVMPKPCTGCGLCLAPCPVDCIRLVAAAARIKMWVWSKPDRLFESRP